MMLQMFKEIISQPRIMKTGAIYHPMVLFNKCHYIFEIM